MMKDKWLRMIHSSNSMPNKALHHIIAIKISKLAEIVRTKIRCMSYHRIKANQMHALQ
jgi:hypothetical protein